MKHLLLSSAAAVVLTVASPAFAGTITLDFGPLASTATNAQIQSYIDGMLPSGDSVVVTGAAGSCNNTDTCPYNADGHVVGPSGTSYTLANKDGGTFIGTGGDFNTTPSGANAITMTFSGPDFTGSNALQSIAFDYEIFPNNSCTALGGNNCGGSSNPNIPDLAVSANATLLATYYGVVPGATGSYNTAWVDSPQGSAVTGHNPETAPQLIGSADLTIPAGTTELTFADWPAAIGIDNLVLTTGACTPGTSGCSTDTPVPEPGSMPLLGAYLALGGLAFGRRSVKQI
jgi:hypothetical protein